jgi:hypothetical protein
MIWAAPTGLGAAGAATEGLDGVAGKVVVMLGLTRNQTENQTDFLGKVSDT